MRAAARTPGQLATAALASTLLPASPAGVSVPLLVRANLQGLQQLVHRESGDVMGICASPAIAQRTQNFFR